MKQFEQTYDWDTGYLYLTSEALSFVGEQVRFALRPAQILSLCLGPGVPRWGASHRVYISWEDTGMARKGAFNLRPVGVRSLGELERAVVRLHEWLQAWLHDLAQAATSPEPLLRLESPALGEVTGTPLNESRIFRTFFTSSSTVALVAVGASLVFDLPFARQAWPLGWYVVGLSTLTLLLHSLPSWYFRWRGQPCSNRI